MSDSAMIELSMDQMGDAFGGVDWGNIPLYTLYGAAGGAVAGVGIIALAVALGPVSVAVAVSQLGVGALYAVGATTASGAVIGAVWGALIV